MAALERLGAKSLPVIAVGGKFVVGQSLNHVAELLGLGERFPPKLDSAALMDRLDRFIAAAQRFHRQIPDSQLADTLPNRDRTLRVLAHHMYRVPAAFLETAGGAELTKERLEGAPTDAMDTFDAIARYDEVVGEEARSWWASLEDRSCAAIVATYFGPQTLHEVMDRTAGHLGQHCRQVMWHLENQGIAPDRPLTGADFADLPMPRDVWDG